MYGIGIKNITYVVGSNECIWKKVFTDEERDTMTQGLYYVGKFSLFK